MSTPPSRGRVYVLARAFVYSTLFIGFLLVFLPARVVARSGVVAPANVGLLQMIGIGLAITGALLAVSCILTFVFVGRGTPAPFDPPRRLVVRGLYRFVRNPMYIGAAVALLGAALYYESLGLAAYAAIFLVAMHLFVTMYEEPMLGRTFGSDYERYRLAVGRWIPRP